MNTRHTKTLAIVLAAMLAGLFTTSLVNDQDESSTGVLLFPDLKAQINQISQVSVSKAGESATMNNHAGEWVLVESQNYPVDPGKLRQLLVSLADAKILEEKTSNAKLYERLGVEDTAADNQGTEIRFGIADDETSIIIGNLAQRNYRFARIRGETESWLIDRNPVVPADISDWLLPKILNIDSIGVQAVTITHSNGESIHIEKDHRAARNFAVSQIPDGREILYPSVVDGIADVMNGLNLEDVAEAAESHEDESFARTVFTTFDGLTVTIDSSMRDEDTWISLHAVHADAESDEVTMINDRVVGWTYQIQAYKADQLRRRWDDILKAVE